MIIDFDLLGRRISQRCHDLGLKQSEMAEKADISNNDLSNIENGRSIPSIATFASICSVLKMTPDYFLLGTMKANDIPANIVDILRLCNNESLELIDNIIQCVLKCQK